jgi:hypothetical protein
MSHHPYQEYADEQWAQRVSETLSLAERGDDYLLHGRCPRCDDEMFKLLRIDEIVQDTVRGIPERVVVICNCTQDHAGRPEGKSGCGAYGALLIEV